MAAKHVGNHAGLLVGLTAESLCMFLLWCASSKAVLIILLACEGLAYAGFMVAGQTYVARCTTEANRGKVGGIHAMLAGGGRNPRALRFRCGGRTLEFAPSSPPPVQPSAPVLCFWGSAFGGMRSRIPGLGAEDHERRCGRRNNSQRNSRSARFDLCVHTECSPRIYRLSSAVRVKQTGDPRPTWT